MTIASLFADIIPEGNYHLLGRKVYITNLDAHQNITLLGCVDAVMPHGYTAYKIQQNEQLERGYKFNTLRLLAIPTNLLKEFGDINVTATHYYQAQETPFSKKLNDIAIAKDSFVDLNYLVGGFYISDDDHRIADDYYYEIKDIEKESLTLKLVKREITFDNGSRKTITY